MRTVFFVFAVICFLRRNFRVWRNKREFGGINSKVGGIAAQFGGISSKVGGIAAQFGGISLIYFRIISRFCKFSI
jgi:hypothetical protein